jgi:hypothetical protein
VNVAARYDLAELSLVDNPSNPDALGVSIVRDAVPDLALLDRLEDGAGDLPTLNGRDADVGMPARRAEGDGRASPPSVADDRPDGDSDQDGGDASAGPGAPLAARDALHTAARGILAGCGCALCALALAALDAEEAGDSIGGDDAQEDREMRGMGRAVHARVTAAVLRTSARELARLDVALRELLARWDTPRAAVRATGSGANAATAEAEVAALRARVERLEAQPLPGGPAARAVEKTLAAVALDSGYGVPPAGAETLRSLNALEALAGRLHDPQAQMAVAAEMIRLQQGQG